MRQRAAEFFVNQSEWMLPGDRNVVLEVCVDEDVGIRFVIGLGVANKVPVGIGNGCKAIGTIGFEGGATAPGLKPVGQVGLVDMGEKELFLVVSVKERGVVFFFDTDEEFDDAFGVGAAVDVVADENQMVFRSGRDDLDHLFERVEAAVNIADSKCSHKSVGRVCRLRATS